MAGHSHWAGIKHKKGKADKEKSKIFSKLSKEITVAAKLGSTEIDTNPRLRLAVQLAKKVNMPKSNIERAIKKSEISSEANYQNLRYEGFGPFKVAFVIETLTNNKNRTASNIRTIFQRYRGSLGEAGVASHNFNHLGIFHVEKENISGEKILEYSIESGAQDCILKDSYFEILSTKEDFYKVKKKLELKVGEISFAQIGWVPIHKITVNEEQVFKINDFINALKEDDDVQKIYTNFDTKSSS